MTTVRKSHVKQDEDGREVDKGSNEEGWLVRIVRDEGFMAGAMRQLEVRSYTMPVCCCLLSQGLMWMCQHERVRDCQLSGQIGNASDRARYTEKSRKCDRTWI